MKNINQINQKNLNIILGNRIIRTYYKWGYDNFASLIKKLNKMGDYYFYLLCGKDEEEGAKKIINQMIKKIVNLLDQRCFGNNLLYILSNIFIGNDSLDIMLPVK